MNELRGEVFNWFPSITAFAESLKWDRAKVSRIVNGRQRPTADEMETIAKELRISDEVSFVRIFFPSLFHKVAKR